ncbi:hypothetical protein TRFO_12448 [Tritrichomonas foetus]|uniref:Uncharacterized protein n=1 Tax=Tritrichomonas foetus TaxID=1144522 RepID=A0A1J4L5T1_9EUKA|nr:hypothetical protein TRFO_12448 [Tritrichomonas foetus]|eukprot:OHT17310.1 hypothetical protein TRFO_12448 [Tritrichomonas foetus]
MNALSKQQSLTISKNDCATLDGPIISFARTQGFIFVATKKAINRFHHHLSSQDRAITRSPGNENITRINQIYYNSRTLLIIQTDSKVYAIDETNFSKAQPAVIINRTFKFFAVLPRTPYVVFFDNQNLYLYTIYTKIDSSIVAELKNQTPHQMRGAYDLLATSNLVLIYDKRNYKIYNIDLKLTANEPVPRGFKCVTPIDGVNAFVAVQENTLIQLSDNRKLITEEVKFPEDVLALQVKLPYVYAVSQRNLMYFLTITSLKDNIVPLQFKARYPNLFICDDFSAILSNDSQIYHIKYTPKTDIAFLKATKQWSAAIEMHKSMGMPLEELYGSMADANFSQKKFKDAFDAFRRSRRHPFELIGRFSLATEELKTSAKKDAETHRNQLSTLYNLLTRDPQASESELNNAIRELYEHAQIKEIPTIDKLSPETLKSQIEEAKEVENEIVQKLSDRSKRIDEELKAFPYLKEYIEDIMLYEKQPTKAKIYNTILAEVYTKNAFMPLKDFIEKGHPLFFHIVAKALQESQAYEALLLLCEQYNEHQLAIKTAKESSYEQLISYVSNSKNCLKLAPTVLKDVFDHYKKEKKLSDNECAKKAAGLFCSHHLSTKATSLHGEEEKSDIERVCDIIDSADIGKAQNDMKTAFLHFVVFTLQAKSPSVHSQLVNLYIDKLRSNFALREGRKYIPINSKEEDTEVRQTRESLRQLLTESDYYEPREVIQKLPDSFLEEKLAALLKINTTESIEKCIELVVSNKVDFEIALNFCETAYDRNDPDRCDVYNKLFFRLKQTYANDNQSLVESITTLLNEKALYLNPVNIIENIPKEIPLKRLTDFFNLATMPRINSIRGLRLRNALMDTTIKEKEKQIQILRSGKVVVSHGLKCIVCGKTIGDAVFYVLGDSTVAHAGCNPNHE